MPTVKSLDVIVPIMAGCYFLMTLYVVFTNLPQLPGVLTRIFSEAFGLRQAAAGGFGAVVMNGVKRGLFSNEAGSGSAPCAAAAAECDDPVKMGLVQALGVLIDTIVICSCTAFVMLLAPERRDRWAAGHESVTGGDAVSPGRPRSGVHCRHAGTVQLLNVYRDFVLCTMQRGLSLWRPLGLADRL